MRRQLQSFQAWSTSTRTRVRIALLAPAVVLMCHPVMAALPTLTTPTEGIGGTTVSNDDWLGTMGAYFKIGITIFALVLAGLGFIQVMSGGLAKWKAYSMGRAELGDLKEYFIMGAVLGAFMVILATYALSTIA
jgi:integrating conjugative element membrane protein (TIGR03745 family)